MHGETGFYTFCVKAHITLSRMRGRTMRTGSTDPSVHVGAIMRLQVRITNSFV